ncbi:hypothetical protein CWE09_13175 [Aliidiomarina minuta]|uniref:Response regulatory domain-containing protein n=1 Tax=Aliidiomarina minuta TaxID=880057 RepID=A0A432W498_9GAMM|nr:response regulator [Aliidiomarina minuta]RUO24089.1 hypothetical protein CWE09_13175 [Aliidiomarina minuta]
MDIIIIEDNPETLGVLRDFFRSVDTSASIQTYTNGNSLLEGDAVVAADILILGYDLGVSVTGTELLSYLEWSHRISAKTQVVFVSNTIEQARRQAPLRFTVSNFYNKPVSLAHVATIVKFARRNRDYFSSVFYMIDKQKWAAAYKSLQLCKQGCPAELEEQALLIEFMLNVQQGSYSHLLRRVQSVKELSWAPYIRVRALAALGQYEKCKQLFSTYDEKDPYFSASLAVVNQLAVTSHSDPESFMPAHLKDSDLSLFECEYKAALLTNSGNWLKALGYLANKQKRAPKRSHKAYFYSVAIVKNLCLELFQETDNESYIHLEKHLEFHAQLLQQDCQTRDLELFQELLPALVQALQCGKLREQETSGLIMDDMEGGDNSPFVYILRYIVKWLEEGKASVPTVYQCALAIERQGSTSRAATNQLLLQKVLEFTLKKPVQRAFLSNQLGKMLFKSGRADLAAMTFTRGVSLQPDNQKMSNNLQACMRHLDVRQFLGHEVILTGNVES